MCDNADKMCFKSLPKENPSRELFGIKNARLRKKG